MRRLLKDHPRLFCALCYAALSALYFLAAQLPLERHVIHTALDDRIPFLPGFIVPYVLWYAYVPALLLYVSGRSDARFRRQMAVLFSGMLVCLATFVLFPTRIDFRPDAAGEGALRALCRLIYANDKPHNVLPSMHCFESVLLHLEAFGPGTDAPAALRAASAVTAALICLSTVFIKQHAVPDALVGCALALVLHALANRIETRKRGNAPC